jgi:hypothetical protein
VNNLKMSNLSALSFRAPGTSSAGEKASKTDVFLHNPTALASQHGFAGSRKNIEVQFWLFRLHD